MIREFLAVAARAALEWALASLLLANGAAFCLIAAAAARLRLGPPCIVCARVHRLLCSSSSAASATGVARDALRLLLCDAHLAAVAPDRYDGDGGVSETDADDDPNKVSGMETHRDVSIGSEICEQEQDGNKPHGGGIASADDGNGPLVSLFELAPIVSRPREDDDSIDQLATMPQSLSLTVDGDESLTLGELVAAFRAQRRELHALRAELAAERRLKAEAEAEEYQRQLEEQGELDREAARLAMQLVYESEAEKHGLQRQLDACGVRAQLCQSDPAAMEDAGGDDGNNYQSLVDFLPGSVHSSSPDLANLLKLYTESGNAGRRPRDGCDVPAVAVDEEEGEVAVTAATESIGSVEAAVDAPRAVATQRPALEF